jgi:hypothetical protein
MSQTQNAELGRFVIHPAATHFPDLPDKEFDELKRDIAERGLAEPILKKGNVVLDGRHRLRACQELGIEPRFLEFEGDDEAAEIASRNIFRRHLTNDQRVAILAKVLGPKLAQEAEARMKAGELRAKSTQGAGRVHEALAKQAQVGDYKARSALAVGKRSPQILDEVIEGKLRLSEAKKQTEEHEVRLSAAAANRRRLQKERTLEESVQIRFKAFIDYFPQPQHREVKKYLRELL